MKYLVIQKNLYLKNLYDNGWFNKNNKLKFNDILYLVLS